MRLMLKSSVKIIERFMSSKITNEYVLNFRNSLFEKELQRQRQSIKRIEKIEIKVLDNMVKCNKPESMQTLMMNKYISTPFHCAQHISEVLTERSVIALVNEEPWDMHRPLLNDATVKFLHFKSENPDAVNRAYWRSCSLILGYLLESCFKDDYFIELCSFPSVNFSSGSFVYDVKLNIDTWKPSKEELRCISIQAYKLREESLNFERLKVDVDLAYEMFKYNKFKQKQVPLIADRSPNKNTVILYRLGKYVDMSQGPMIANTQFIGRFELASMHDIQSPDYGTLQRVQAVSIPSQLHLHYWTFDFLVNMAAKLNTAPVPTLKVKSAAEIR